jgi:hypothetical protein
MNSLWAIISTPDVGRCVVMLTGQMVAAGIMIAVVAMRPVTGAAEIPDYPPHTAALI